MALIAQLGEHCTGIAEVVGSNQLSLNCYYGTNYFQQPCKVTGVDYTGALYVRNAGIETKVYICLFTCATTRAIHPEVVEDLTVKAFLLAFRRFASRKSLPRKLISDNASTFVSANNELRELFQSRALEETLAREGIEWLFISKKAPWYGGFLERLIGLTKSTIKKVLSRAAVNLCTLQTIDDRPLTYVSSDISIWPTNHVTTTSTSRE